MLITLFNCGTRYDVSNKEELIARLYASTGGEKYIFAGPGSNAMSRSDYDPFSEKRGLGWVNPFSIARDSAVGSGMQYNVSCLMTYLESQKEVPSVINMVGWSRGAVTCIMMANAIQSKYEEIVVNIFCIDPVPGPSNFSKETLRVPSCVKKITTIIMENAHSTGFEAGRLYLQDSEKTDARIFPFPGSHSSCVMDKDGIPTQPGYVIHYLAEKFLAKHDTPISTSHHVTDVDLLDTYGKIIIDTDKYMSLTADMGRRTLGGKKSWYIMNNHITDFNYYVNRHHEKVFKRKCSNLLFGGEVKSIPWIEENLKHELDAYLKKLKDLAMQAPHFVESLKCFHLINSKYR